jgi:predicted alpha/beta-fold hydrolase
MITFPRRTSVLSFRPLPLLGNPHVQTILGNLLTGVPRTSRAQKRIVALPDGDRIMLHETAPRLISSLPPGERSGVRKRAPIALLVHGLGGSHRSAYMARMTNRLGDLGWRVFRMDLRGAGAGIRLARRFYNAGCSEDVRVVVEYLSGAFPETPLTVLGFSLGGNIVLKLAGELAARPLPSLRAVATIAPPIDLVRCSERLARFPFYDAFYVHHLTSQVAQHQQHLPDVPQVVFPRRINLRQFDDLYTAPRWGYTGALDYYRQASALPWIPAIRVPTFILTARDDPFVAVEPFQTLPALAAVEVHICEHGGHLGFLGCDGIGGVRWAEAQLANWLTKQIP